MGYATEDDDIYGHPKFKRVGLAAGGLWEQCLKWTCKYGYCGRIDIDVPYSCMTRIDREDGLDVEVLIARLVKANLWEELRDGDVLTGWQVHDWHTQNLTPAEQKAKKSLAAKRQRQFRERQAQARAELKAAAQGSVTGDDSTTPRNAPRNVTKGGRVTHHVTPK